MEKTAAETPRRRARTLDGLAAADLAEAKRRFAIIKSLVRSERRTEDEVAAVAAAQGVSRATIYRWLRAYETRRMRRAG
jgi:putative transposase